MHLKNRAKNVLNIFNLKMKPCISSYTVPSDHKTNNKPKSIHLARQILRHQDSSIEKSTVNEEATVHISAELSSQNYSVTVSAPMTEHAECTADDYYLEDEQRTCDPGDIGDSEAKSMLLLDMSVITRNVDDTLCRHVSDQELDTEIPLHSSLVYPQYSTPTAPQNTAFVDKSVQETDEEIDQHEQTVKLAGKDNVLNHVQNLINMKAAKCGPLGMVVRRETSERSRVHKHKMRVHEIRRLAYRYEHKRLKAKYFEQLQGSTLEYDPLFTKVHGRRTVRRYTRTRDLLSGLGERPQCIGQEASDNYTDNYTDTARVYVPADTRLHGHIIYSQKEPHLTRFMQKEPHLTRFMQKEPHLTRFMQTVSKQRLYNEVLGVL